VVASPPPNAACRLSGVEKIGGDSFALLNNIRDIPLATLQAIDGK
jgi:hypothetical protein